MIHPTGKSRVVASILTGPKTTLQISEASGLQEKSVLNYLVRLRRDRIVYVFGWVASERYKTHPVALYALGDEQDAQKPKTFHKSECYRSKPVAPCNKSWKAFRHPHDVAFFGDAR